MLQILAQNKFFGVKKEDDEDLSARHLADLTAAMMAGVTAIEAKLAMLRAALDGTMASQDRKKGRRAEPLGSSDAGIGIIIESWGGATGSCCGTLLRQLPPHTLQEVTDGLLTSSLIDAMQLEQARASAL